MRKIINKSGILVLLGLFLLAAYLEGISIEPLEDLNPQNTNSPWNSTHNPGSLKGGIAESASKDLASNGLKNRSPASWQADDQKHKAQDHSEEELDAFSIAAISRSGLNIEGYIGIKEAFSSFPGQAEICCRG